MDYSPNIRAGFTGGLKSYQDAMSVGPQTKAIVAKAQYEKAADEQKGRLLAPEEEVLIQDYRNKKAQGVLAARSIGAISALDPNAIGSVEQIAADQNRGVGATAQGTSGSGFRNIAGPGMPPLIQTANGVITQGYPAAFMNKGMPGSITTMEAGSAADNAQGEQMVYVQQYSANALGQPIPIGGKTLITRSSLAALQASNQFLAPQPAPVATAAPAPAAAPAPGASLLGSFATPPAAAATPVNVAAVPLVTSSVDGTAGTPIATPAATPAVTSAVTPPPPALVLPTPANSAVNPTTPNNPPFVQGFGYLNSKQDTVWGPGKNPEDATKRAIVGGYPATVKNINWQSTPGSANSRLLSEQNEASKELKGAGETIATLQKVNSMIGRSLNIGDKVSTYAKLPFIGGFINDIRRVINPDIQALEGLQAQAGQSQAKGIVGGRVAVTEMQQITQALGGLNVTNDVRKELGLAFIVGNQDAIDYFRAKEKYANAYGVITGFDDKYDEYSTLNPLGSSDLLPGDKDWKLNENRITWNLYNALKNKGYSNPNEIALQHDELINRKTGQFNYNALPDGPDAPWTPADVLPLANKPSAEGPISNATSKQPQDLKSFIDLNLRGLDGKIRSKEDILKLFNEATGGK